MSDTARTMATRDFLHGGYRDKNGPVVVLSNGEVAGVWFPGLAAITVNAPVRFARLDGEEPQAVPAVSPRPFTPAPKPSASKKARR